MAGEKGDTDELLDIFDIEDPQLPDEVGDHAFSSGDYPYEEKLKRRIYEEELETLQVELVKLKRHMMEVGKRAIIVFEGRDAAGKGGTINAFKQYMNPRSCRVVALPKPTDKERGQWYFQRYAKHFPTAGEVVLYDRSWYNRAGVEPVMGFCSDEQYEAFLDEVPRFENMLVREGIHFFKFWLDVGREMQMKRFHDRRHSPLKIWKLSPMDLKALTKWGDYTDARDRMLAETHSDKAPWVVVRSNDKRRARLNAIRHFLKSMEYEGKDAKAIGEIDDKILGIGPKFLK